MTHPQHGHTVNSQLRLSMLIPLLFVALSFAFLPAISQAADWDWKEETSLDLLYEGGYSSNILELSDEDITRFEEHRLPLATDVETYDDFVQSFGVHTRIGLPKWWGWRDGSLSYTFRYQSYVKNPYNDRPIHSAYFTHDIINRADIFASYLYIPERYLRDYYDRDTRQVIGTQFDYTLGGAGAQYSPEAIKGLRLSARYEFFTIYYNEYFTEYDSEGWGLRGDVRYRFSRMFTLTGIFKQRWSDNVGFDEQRHGGVISDDPVDSEFGDGSYGEEWYELVADVNLYDILPNRIDLELSARLRHRYYTTDRSLDADPIHAGREHMHWRFSVIADTEIIDGLSAGPAFEYEFRRTDSPLDWVVDTKDFDTFRAYLVLSYEIW